MISFAICIILCVIVAAMVAIVATIIVTTTQSQFIGFWVGSKQFLRHSDIYYIGVDISEDTLTVVIKPRPDSSSITQIYSYEIDSQTISLEPLSTSGVDYILPTKDLNISYNEKLIKIYDDDNIYLELEKFEDVDS
jgi:hypothetical protein